MIYFASNFVFGILVTSNGIERIGKGMKMRENGKDMGMKTMFG